MRTLTAYWIGVVIVLAVLNGIRALPAGSRARRSMRNMGIAAAVLGSLAIVALKWGSQNANSPSTPDAQQINGVSTTPDDIMQVQVRLIDLGYMIGPPDGLWGNKSRQALRAFKAANGIQTDDKWDSEISAKLFSTQAAPADNGGGKGRAVTAESELAERTHGSIIPNPGPARSRNDMRDF